MSWAIGFDSRWGRDIGYGVPAICDFPGCDQAIDRGLAFVCGGVPYGGEYGCGLFFCDGHMFVVFDAEIDLAYQQCERCEQEQPPFEAKPDTREWIEWKLTDESWAQWRAENPAKVEAMQEAVQRARTAIGTKP